MEVFDRYVLARLAQRVCVIARWGINGRLYVVFAKVPHWCCGIQARVAPIDRLDYNGVVVNARGRSEVVSRSLGCALKATEYMALEYERDARRAKKDQNKTFHLTRAACWWGRHRRLRRLMEREAALIGGRA